MSPLPMPTDEARKAVTTGLTEILCRIRQLSTAPAPGLNEKMTPRSWYGRWAPTATIRENLIHLLADVSHNWPAWLEGNAFFSLRDFATDLDRAATNDISIDEWREIAQVLGSIAGSFRAAAPVPVS